MIRTKILFYLIIISIFQSVFGIEKNSADSHWLTITTTPLNADIYIDSVLVHTGKCSIKLQPGTYKYSVELSQFHSASGEVELINKDVNLNIKLSKSYGSISITTTPEPGARIFMDGKEVIQSTPCVIGKIPSGNHLIKLTKLNFHPFNQNITVVDGETCNLDVSLKPSNKNLVIHDDNSVQKTENENAHQPTKKMNINVEMVRIVADFKRIIPAMTAVSGDIFFDSLLQCQICSINI